MLRARAILERQLALEEDTVRELTERSELFCTVSDGMLTFKRTAFFRRDPDARLFERTVGGRTWRKACGQMPRAIGTRLDANRKLETVRATIRRLDEQLGQAGRDVPLNTRLTAPSALSSSHEHAHARLARKRSSKGSFAVLLKHRGRVLAEMGRVGRALGRGHLPEAKRHARSAASLLSAMSRLRSRVRHRLDRVLQRTRVTHAQIVAKQAALAEDPVPGTILAWANARGIGRAELLGRVVKASVTSTDGLESMSASEFLCSPALDEMDKSLAAGYRQLARL